MFCLTSCDHTHYFMQISPNIKWSPVFQSQLILKAKLELRSLRKQNSFFPLQFFFKKKRSDEQYQWLNELQLKWLNESELLDLCWSSVWYA